MNWNFEISTLQADGSWSLPAEVGVRQQGAFATPIQYGEALYLYYASSVETISYISTTDCVNWSQPTLIDVTNCDANNPAIVNMANTLYLVIGGVSTPLTMSIFSSGAWSTSQIALDISTNMYALTQHENQLYLAYVTPYSGLVNFAFSVDGVYWTEISYPDNIFSSVSPVFFHQSGVWYLVTVNDGSIQFWTASDPGTWTGPIETGFSTTGLVDFAIAPGGSLVISFPAPAPSYEVTFITSTDGGQTWTASNVPSLGPLAILFTADPQYPWADNPDIPDNQKDAYSRMKIGAQFTSMGAAKALLAGKGANVQGLIINGDLTAFGHGNELKEFKNLLGQLNGIPYYLGLGNHDYANNVNDCFNNGCARDMVDFEIQEINKLKIFDSDYSTIANQSSVMVTGSLAYSFNIGNIHLIQLQNYPTYTNSWTSYVGVSVGYYITSSMNWLESDLQAARARGDVILVNLHDYDDHFQPTTEFDQLMVEYNVSAVFRGHYHGNINLQRYIEGQVPLFNCGSPTYNQYLAVTFPANSPSFYVATVQNGDDGTLQGSPTFTAYPINQGEARDFPRYEPVMKPSRSVAMQRQLDEMREQGLEAEPATIATIEARIAGLRKQGL